MELVGIIIMDCGVIDELLIKYSAFVKYLNRKNGNTVGHTQLYVDFKKTYDLVRRKVLCNILIEFCIPIQLVMLIKMCINQTYRKAQRGNICVMHFLVRLV